VTTSEYTQHLATLDQKYRSKVRKAEDEYRRALRRARRHPDRDYREVLAQNIYVLAVHTATVEYEQNAKLLLTLLLRSTLNPEVGKN